jgi:hypothetical protein
MIHFQIKNSPAFSSSHAWFGIKKVFFHKCTINSSNCPFVANSEYSNELQRNAFVPIMALLSYVCCFRYKIYSVKAVVRMILRCDIGNLRSDQKSPKILFIFWRFQIQLNPSKLFLKFLIWEPH